MSTAKPLVWIGRAREELQGFPPAARHDAGVNLRVVQEGEEPEDWKPLGTVGAGARELRVRTRESGTLQHRVVYVARFPEAVYVLHAFQKTTRATSRHNLEVARARYAQLLRNRGQKPETRDGG